MEDLIERVLRRCTEIDADEVTIRIEHPVVNQVALRNEQPVLLYSDDSTGIGITIEKNGGIGFAATNNLEIDSIEDMINRIKVKASCRTFLLQKPMEDKVVKHIGEIPSIEEIYEELLQIGRFLEKKNVHTKTLSITVETRERWIATLSGTLLYSSIPRTSFAGMLAISEEGFGTAHTWLQCGQSKGWDAIRDWKLERILTDQINSMSAQLKHEKKAPRGRVDAVLAPEVSARSIHELFGHPLEADRILGDVAITSGYSSIKNNMINKKISIDEITVIDDPTIEHSFGFYLYDDEGAKATKRCLVENGYIKQFLHNKSTATWLGCYSNASGRASDYDKQPIVRMANTYMEPGTHNLDELIEEIDYGIYMVSYNDWDMDNTKYSHTCVGREAYLIEQGKITNPVKNPILKLTPHEFYGMIDAVGNEITSYSGICGKGEPHQSIPVSLGAPAIRLRGARFTHE
jgi:TldD protein